MAFRKRNIGIGSPTTSDITPPANNPRGTKPSSLTSQPVTSTGTPSLDAVLGGHGGLPLGISLLVEERGTTDFSGALLRYFAAQGICHGHEIHLVGMDDSWIKSLPGVVEARTGEGKESVGGGEGEKMKIAWRYESLGQAAERALPQRSPAAQTKGPSLPETTTTPFSHSFDLSKRLSIPQDAKIHYIPIPPTSSPFDKILHHLSTTLLSSPTTTIHRLIIPTLLTPALWPPHSSQPQNVLRFLHSLRSLLRQHLKNLTAIISLPLELYPRTSSLVRWAEILSDSVMELQPFAHALTASSALAESGGARSGEDQPQGLFRVRKLPVSTERGEGGAGVENSIGMDLGFTVSRRKFVIQPFSLPPLEAEERPQEDGRVKLTGQDVEF